MWTVESKLLHSPLFTYRKVEVVKTKNKKRRRRVGSWPAVAHSGVRWWQWFFFLSPCFRLVLFLFFFPSISLVLQSSHPVFFDRFSVLPDSLSFVVFVFIFNSFLSICLPYFSFVPYKPPQNVPSSVFFSVSDNGGAVVDSGSRWFLQRRQGR